MKDSTIIYLEDIKRAPHLLSITYLYQSYRFEVALWYETNLEELDQKYSAAFMDNIYFHIAAFEMNKLTSLKPDEINFGKYAHFATEEFWILWQTIQQKALAQWRFENDLPFYKVKLAHSTYPKTIHTEAIIPGNIEVLAFFGGGKDSLVAARLLEKGNIPYSILVYAHSIYGKTERQHEIIDALLEKLHPQKVHKQYIFDSFTDAPIVKMKKQFNVKSLMAAETPASIFGSLPILMSEGYTYIGLANEHSANIGNLIWDKTGEDVNHQWVKSYEAERLINAYIQTNLLTNFAYFSFLQPINDVLIFNLLRQDLDKVAFTHSCNLEKPWCKRCAKCAYVWLNYMAYLPTELVNNMFGHVNLFDLPENQIHFEQMLGFGEQTPFECLGQIEESRLALHLCFLKGIKGKAMHWHEKIANENYDEIIERFSRIHTDNALPPQFANLIYPQFSEVQKQALAYLQQSENALQN